MKYHCGLSLSWFSVKGGAMNCNTHWPELWLAPFHHGQECSLMWAMAGLGYGWHPFTMVGNDHWPGLWLAPFYHGQRHSLTWVMAGILSPWSGTLTDLGYGWHPFSMVGDAHWPGLWLVPSHIFSVWNTVRWGQQPFPPLFPLGQVLVVAFCPTGQFHKLWGIIK